MRSIFQHDSIILIDESLIGLINRTELIQYIPNKYHHKWEYNCILLQRHRQVTLCLPMSTLERSALDKLQSLSTPIMLWRSCWPRQIYWTTAIIVMLITFTQAQFWLNNFLLRKLFWPAAWGQTEKGFLLCSSQPNLKWVRSFTQQSALCLLFPGRKRSSRGAHAWCSRLVLLLW